MKNNLILTLVFFLTACSTQVDLVNSISGYDVSLGQNGSKLPCSEVDIVVLDSLFEIPQKLIATNKYYFVQTRKNVLCYGKDGRLLNSIGQKGHGAEEYINLATFYLDADDTVVLVDSYRSKLLKYTCRGKFVESINTRDEVLSDAHNACLINHNELWLNNYVFNNKNSIYELLSLENENVSHIVSTSLQSNSTKEPIGLHPYSFYKNKLIYIKPFDNIIYDRMGNGVYQILTNRKVYSKQDLGKIKDYSIMTYVNALNTDHFVGFTDLFETDKYIMAACKNYDYIFLDKQKMTCVHLSYAIEQNLKYFPMLNIMASTDNQLLGIIDTNILEKVKNYSKEDRNLQKLIALPKKSIALVVYKF